MRFRDERESRIKTSTFGDAPPALLPPPPPPGTTDLCLKHQSERAGSARVKLFDQHDGDAARVTPGVR